jgi:hypothetical protein
MGSDVDADIIYVERCERIRWIARRAGRRCLRRPPQ